MCIRDREPAVHPGDAHFHLLRDAVRARDVLRPDRAGQAVLCLLYTSDAADERSSVDLGGRRIIKKKNMKMSCARDVEITKQQKCDITQTTIEETRR